MPDVVGAQSCDHKPGNVFSSVPVEADPAIGAARRMRLNPLAARPVNIECLHLVGRYRLTPMRPVTLKRASCNLQHETSAVFVELKAKQVDPLLPGASEMR